MSKFQIILLVVFGIFIVVGVAVFSLYRGSGAGDVSLTIWGDISTNDFTTFISEPDVSQGGTISVNYVERPLSSIDTDFTEALARGSGPDLIMVTQDRFWENKPKLIPIPYSSLSERDFKNTFVEEGELFLTKEGVYAVPLSIDPMVLYYNRDLLSSAALARPLSYWDEIYAEASNLSKRDAAGNLVTSVMALGEARNIPHAKDTFSLLMLQAGTPITKITEDRLQSQIANDFNLTVAPAESALEFYTQFSNPTKTFYSWNRSQIDAQTHFTSGDSAYYLGFASEFRVLKNKNPTLNLGVARVPQSRISGNTITFGRIRALAISRGSHNPSAALQVAMSLAANDKAIALAELLVLPPARRDLLSQKPTDSIFSVFYEAALQSRGWIDPNNRETKDIFNEAIESVTSGRARTSEAVQRVNNSVNALIQ